MAPHGLPVRKGPLCSCWLLSEIYPSCCSSRDQSIPLPEACSKQGSCVAAYTAAGRSVCQASTCAKCSSPCRVCAWLPGSVQQMFSSCWWARPIYSVGLLPPAPCPVQTAPCSHSMVFHVVNSQTPDLNTSPVSHLVSTVSTTLERATVSSMSQPTCPAQPGNVSSQQHHKLRHAAARHRHRPNTCQNILEASLSHTESTKQTVLSSRI